MSRYRFIRDFSEAPGVEPDPDNVRFLTDVFSESFKYRNRDVVARKDIEPQLLDRLESQKLVEPNTIPTGERTFYRKGSVVTAQTLGEELAGRLTLSGVIVDLPPVEAGDDFTMTETPAPEKKKRKKNKE